MATVAAHRCAAPCEASTRDARDPVSRHRPERRQVRAPEARRDGRGDRVQRRPGRAGAHVRGRRASTTCTSSISTARSPASRSTATRSMRSWRPSPSRRSSAAASATWRPSRPGSTRASRRVILGTVAVRDPELVRRACSEFPGRIAVGIDAKGGKVAVEGWAETSELTAERAGQALRGRGRRGHHLHRHRARRRAEGPQPAKRRPRSRARPRSRSSPRAALPRIDDVKALLQARVCYARRRHHRPRAL